jgi:hypothetical protein
MKTVKLDVSAEIAKRILSEYERDISTKTRTRDELDAEISKLEESAKSLRSQLHIGNGAGAKALSGENKKRIIEYLRGIGDKGAKLIQIHRGTGIAISSVIFTLKGNADTFKKTPRKAWKLVKGSDANGDRAETEQAMSTP